jgi:hypothetical protein
MRNDPQTRSDRAAAANTIAAFTLAVLGVLGAASLAACGDGSVSELDGAGGAGPQSGGGSGQGFGGGGSGGGGIAGDAGGPSKAETMFRALLPDLTQACGGACHVDGSGGAPAFLSGSDPYKTIATRKGIVVKDTSTSSLLNKGRHEGPELLDPLRTKVFQWLDLESQALAAINLPTTDAFTVADGANTIDISKGGANLAGAKLTFNASASGNLLTLTNMQLVAPASSGVHIVFPIFDVIPAKGAEIKDQSFSNADQTVAAGQTATLRPGILILTQWDPAGKMRIEFTKLESGSVSGGDAGAGGGGGGCKSVASFTANAVPAIQQNGCLNCHNTGGSGNGALDLSALGMNPRDDARACAQALTRSNVQTPAQSDIILAPTGGVAAHPFKNASQNYATMIEAWLVNEK